MKQYWTHIWDPVEYSWFLEHPTMIFTTPACAEYYGMTRKDRIALLAVPEAMLLRGTALTVDCPVCAYINQSIDAEAELWDDLASV